MFLLCFVPVHIVLLFLRFVLGCLKQIIRLVKFRLSFLLVFFVCLFCMLLFTSGLNKLPTVKVYLENSTSYAVKVLVSVKLLSSFLLKFLQASIENFIFICPCHFFNSTEYFFDYFSSSCTIKFFRPSIPND